MTENIFKEGFSDDFLQEYNQSAIDGFNFSLDTFGIDVTIEGLPKKILVKNKAIGNEKEISTLSGNITIGDIVEIKNQKWLTIDLPDENDIYIKAVIKRCNITFPIKRNTQKIIVGRDKDGRPQASEKFDLINEPCIATTSYPSSKSNEQMPLPEGMIDIIIKYQDADNIGYGQSFKLYNQKYEIINIDYTKVIDNEGIMVIRGFKEVGK